MKNESLYRVACGTLIAAFAIFSYGQLADYQDEIISYENSLAATYSSLQTQGTYQTSRPEKSKVITVQNADATVKPAPTGYTRYQSPETGMYYDVPNSYTLNRVIISNPSTYKSPTGYTYVRDPKTQKYVQIPLSGTNLVTGIPILGPDQNANKQVDKEQGIDPKAPKNIGEALQLCEYYTKKCAEFKKNYESSIQLLKEHFKNPNSKKNTEEMIENTAKALQLWRDCQKRLKDLKNCPIEVHSDLKTD